MRSVTSTLTILKTLAFYTCFLPAMTLAGGAEPLPTTPPWTIYLGGFGAGYNVNNHKIGIINYVDIANQPYSHINELSLVDNGLLGGGQVGFLYQTRSNYQYGLELTASSGTAAAKNRRFFTFPSFNTTSSVLVFFAAKLTYLLDLTFKIGIPVTSSTHMIFKIGPSFTQVGLTGTFFFPISSTLSVSPFTLGGIGKISLYGGVFGLGLVKDINRYFSVYGEYDFNYYADRKFSGITGSVENFILKYTSTINIKSRVHSVRAGFMLRFCL